MKHLHLASRGRSHHKRAGRSDELQEKITKGRQANLITRKLERYRERKKPEQTVCFRCFSRKSVLRIFSNWLGSRY
jgi:hypothetical protein